MIARSGDGGLDVSFSVKNTGRIASEEVPPVYLGPPSKQPAGVQFAIRSFAGFAGFARMHLNPEQSQIVSIHVPLRSLQYWSVQSGGWVTGAGNRIVYAGRSSRDLPLQTTIHG